MFFFMSMFQMRNNSNSCGGEGVEQFPHQECERYVTHVDCGLTTVVS